MNKKEYIISMGMILLLIFIMPFPAYAAGEIGKITRLKGTAQIFRVDVELPITASVGMAANLNDSIRTAAESSLRIQLNDGSMLSMGEKARIKLDRFEFGAEKKTRSALFNMLRGKLRVYAKDLPGFDKKDFMIKTPTAVCGVRGTLFMVWVKSDTVTKIVCFKNAIEVASLFKPEEYIVLTPNQSTDVILKNLPTKPILMSPQQLEQFEIEHEAMGGTVRPVGGFTQPGSRVPVVGDTDTQDADPASGTSFIRGEGTREIGDSNILTPGLTPTGPEQFPAPPPPPPATNGGDG